MEVLVLLAVAELVAVLLGETLGPTESVGSTEGLTEEDRPLEVLADPDALQLRRALPEACAVALGSTEREGTLVTLLEPLLLTEAETEEDSEEEKE